jgi:glycosyltransferase involved in cell wall biosynthesis
VSAPIEQLEAAADVDGHELTQESARDALGIAHTTRLALCVARLAPEKRIGDLIREFGLALPLVPDAQLVVIGDGGEREALLRLAGRLGLEGRVHVLPEVPHERLGLWYAAADVHVTASRSETGPLTVVEAMAAGVPTIAYDGPGFEDRIVPGDNGMLLPDEEGALAAALSLVLGDADVRGCLRAGARAHAPQHLPGRVTEGLLGCYEALLSR